MSALSSLSHLIPVTGENLNFVIGCVIQRLLLVGINKGLGQLLVHLIRHAGELGLVTFDFTHGDDKYVK